ncbi:MAG: hypothetical protein BTN85_1356 [Candidatus Methanohalarchaeum thermophilum]|uniref:Uncharacterized protein n=1 Tax=Methanohalarchaeum thermophilum TaxID=1903181 RepID=A0A1Q6DWW8_METT1|nr:MAG: hypothetical protein BTN85_1356 [Candidatus Methanohalarchaeum thermophilum]
MDFPQRIRSKLREMELPSHDLGLFLSNFWFPVGGSRRVKQEPQKPKTQNFNESLPFKAERMSPLGLRFYFSG